MRHGMMIVGVLTALTVFGGATFAGTAPKLRQTALEFRTQATRTVTTKYLLYLPEGYESANRKFPVIVYLHGGSIRGEDVETVRTKGLPARLEHDRSFPFIVISPLCPRGEIWTDADAIIGLLDEVLAKYPADRKHVYITGHSLGGRGSLYTAFKYPDRFAAVVSMSAYEPSTAWAPRLSRIPIWYFHGTKDPLTPIAGGDALVEAIRANGGNIRYTRLEGMNHFILSLYDKADWSDWLLEHSL